MQVGAKACAAVPPEARVLLPARHTLKVISYNILAPKYSSYNSYCPSQFLAWEYRRELVLRELTHHGADLLGLQECDERFFHSQLRSWAEDAGMQGEFLPRKVGPVPGPTEGIALLWRTAVLEVVARRAVVFAESDPRVAGLPAEVADTEPWRKLVELGEGAVLVLLRHRPTGQLLLGAVTHLFWNPAFPDVKVLQAALLCGEMAAFGREAAAAAATGDTGAAAAATSGSTAAADAVPVVLCGDFNSLAVKKLPDRFDPTLPRGGLVSGVYTLLSGGRLPPGHPDHPHSRVWEGQQQSQLPQGNKGPGADADDAGGSAKRFPEVELISCGLRLGSLNAEAFGREPPVTNRTAGWAGCLDYVWISKPELAVASALAMPYSDGVFPPMGPMGQSTPSPLSSIGDGSTTWLDPLSDVDFPAIPDAVYPSDHLAVGGEVMLLGPTAE